MSNKINEVRYTKVHEAYLIAAKVVARFGDAYLPVFQRLHDEVQKINAAQQIKTLALNIASDIVNSRESKVSQSLSHKSEYSESA